MYWMNLVARASNKVDEILVLVMSRDHRMKIRPFHDDGVWCTAKENIPRYLGKQNSQPVTMEWFGNWNRSENKRFSLSMRLLRCCIAVTTFKTLCFVGYDSYQDMQTCCVLILRNPVIILLPANLHHGSFGNLFYLPPPSPPIVGYHPIRIEGSSQLWRVSTCLKGLRLFFP